MPELETEDDTDLFADDEGPDLSHTTDDPRALTRPNASPRPSGES